MKRLLLICIGIVGVLSCYAQLPSYEASYKSIGTYSKNGELMASENNGIDSITLKVCSFEDDPSSSFSCVVDVTFHYGNNFVEDEKITFFYVGKTDDLYMFANNITKPEKSMSLYISSSRKLVAVSAPDLNGKTWRYYNANP